jgi:hypothetical protein
MVMPPLTPYLVGIMYHEPEPYAAWMRGVMEDYESTRYILIDAPSPEEAVGWGEAIGQAALRWVNADDSLDWKQMYEAWLEEEMDPSGHTRVRVGEMPDLSEFRTEMDGE